jgi:hypothetical protein
MLVQKGRKFPSFTEDLKAHKDILLEWTPARRPISVSFVAFCVLFLSGTKVPETEKDRACGLKFEQGFLTSESRLDRVRKCSFCRHETPDSGNEQDGNHCHGDQSGQCLGVFSPKETGPIAFYQARHGVQIHQPLQVVRHH